MGCMPTFKIALTSRSSNASWKDGVEREADNAFMWIINVSVTFKVGTRGLFPVTSHGEKFHHVNRPLFLQNLVTGTNFGPCDLSNKFKPVWILRNKSLLLVPKNASFELSVNWTIRVDSPLSPSNETSLHPDCRIVTILEKRLEGLGLYKNVLKTRKKGGPSTKSTYEGSRKWRTGIHSGRLKKAGTWNIL